MRYCISYSRDMDFDRIDEIQELAVQFNPSDNTLPAFLEKYSDKIITVELNEKQIKNDDAVKLIVNIAKKYSNVIIGVPHYRTVYKAEIEKIGAEDVKFTFSNPATTWDELKYMVSLHPKRIYVAEELGFEIKKVALFLRQQKIEIGIYPNVAQSQFASITKDIEKFFVRPEDIKYYEPYVDVCLLWGGKNLLAFYYEVYAIQKEWRGNLNQLILGFKEDCPNQGILPIFVERRADCGRRCAHMEDCNICQIIQETAQTLEENQLYIMENKEE